MRLKFSRGNAKLDKSVWHFSLPAGSTCPGASECRATVKVIGDKRKLFDGTNTVFRCFAASQEVLYKNVFEARKYNVKLLKSKRTAAGMAALINESLPAKAAIVRVHVSGDFFNQKYFDAWMSVANSKPDILFYAYTKSLPYWVARLGSIPTNFVLTASRGGVYDSLIDKHGLRSARVVFSEQEAANLGLPIDHDDSHAMSNGGDFALLIHGVQPAKTEAAKAIRKLRLAGITGYSK